MLLKTWAQVPRGTVGQNECEKLGLGFGGPSHVPETADWEFVRKPLCLQAILPQPFMKFSLCWRMTQPENKLAPSP